MLQLASKIPRSIVVAVSGGPDSMALLSFCMRGRKDITVLHVDHKTEHAKEARVFVEKFCKDNALKLVIGDIVNVEGHNENAWREQRLGFYKTLATNQGLYVATAHHLDDLVEWYLLSAIHGKPNFMKPADEEYKLIKPFLFTEKEDLISWCDRFDVPYVIDPTNIGNDNSRAILRSSVIPTLLKIHPGMKTSIKNKALTL